MLSGSLPKDISRSLVESDGNVGYSPATSEQRHEHGGIRDVMLDPYARLGAAAGRVESIG